MDILDKVRRDLTTAIKSKDQNKISALRNIKSSLEGLQKTNPDVDDKEYIQALDSMSKKINQSISEYKKGNRDDLVEAEQKELSVINEYLPKRMSLQDIEAVATVFIDDLNATSMKDMGKVMKAMKEHLGSDAKTSDISQVVKNLLQ